MMTLTPTARVLGLGAQITALLDTAGASKVERYAALAIAKAQVIVSDAPITSGEEPREREPLS